MYGNWIQASITTVTSGSPDTLTLADVSGFPNFDDIFGTSGTTPIMLFTIIEFTDNTRSAISKAQLVYGYITLSTMVLTQTKIIATWNGTTYDNTSPAELTFTAGADTTRVFQGVSDMMPNYSFVRAQYDGEFGHPDGATDLYYPSNHIEEAPSSNAFTADTVYFTPFWWNFGMDREITRAGVMVDTTDSGKAVRAALYAIDEANNGLPGKLIADFGTFSLTTQALVVNTSGSWTSPSAAFKLPPAWYYAAFVSNSNVGSIIGPVQLIPGPLRMNGYRPVRYFSRGMTYGAFNANGASNGSGSWSGGVQNLPAHTLLLGFV